MYVVYLEFVEGRERENEKETEDGGEAKEKKGEINREVLQCRQFR